MTQKERQERSRALIIQAATEEFGTLGYDNVSVELICRKHGISKGMMYHYYRGKDDLFLECVGHTFVLLCQYIEAEAPKLDGPHALENIKLFILGNAGERCRNKHSRALYACKNAAANDICDNALNDLVVLLGLNNIVPALKAVRKLFGELENAVLVVCFEDYEVKHIAF